MGLENVFDNGEAESRAPLLARTTLVGAVESLENARNVILGNASSVVPHLNEHLVEEGDEFDEGLTPLVAVANGVDDEVYELESFAEAVDKIEDK